MPNERNDEPPAMDAWVCRIPRALLRQLAANKELRVRERVLLAVIADLYSDRDGGEGKTGGSRLERITGIDLWSVRRALAQFEHDGIVEATEAQPGQMKRFRLTGSAKVAPGSETGGATVAPGSESAPPPDQKRARGVAQPLRQGGGATSAPALNEEEEEEGTSSRTGAAANAAAPGQAQRLRDAASKAGFGPTTLEKLRETARKAAAR